VHARYDLMDSFVVHNTVSPIKRDGNILNKKSTYMYSFLLLKDAALCDEILLS